MLLNTPLQPVLQALLPSLGPSRYTIDVVAVEVSVVVMRSLWIRVQAPVPPPAAAMSAKLPVQWRHAQSMQSNECSTLHAGSSEQAASASSSVPNSLLQWSANAPLPTRGPSTYTTVSVEDVAVTVMVVVELEVVVETNFSFVQARVSPSTADISSTVPLHKRQNHGWQSYEWRDAQSGSSLHIAIAPSKVLTVAPHRPTHASLSTRGPAM